MIDFESKEKWFDIKLKDQYVYRIDVKSIGINQARENSFLFQHINSKIPFGIQFKKYYLLNTSTENRTETIPQNKAKSIAYC